MSSQLYGQLATELLAISSPSAPRPDYVQGGGGNTSVKAPDGTMAIKASGYELRQLTSSSGIAWVNSSPVANYYGDLETLLGNPADYETASGQLVKQCTFTPEGFESARPSMETGFHSILPAYVVHTHSVYSNLLNCRQDGEVLLEEFISQTGLNAAWVPYYNPGFWLTTAIKRILDKAAAVGKAAPSVFFLQNHGIIVTGRTADEVNQLHEVVNAKLRSFFNVDPSAYPAAPIESIEGSDYNWVSCSPLISQFVAKHPDLDAAYFEHNVLFPDQTVFFNGNFSFDDGGETKIQVDVANGEVRYHTNFREARTIDETLTAYLYIRSQIEQAGGTPRFLMPKDLEYINGMESEVFRKSLLK